MKVQELLTFETDLDLNDVANDVRSSVSRVLDNLPEGAEQPEIFKQVQVCELQCGYHSTLRLCLI